MSHALAVIRSLAVLGSIAALACGGQDSGKTSQPAASPGAAQPAASAPRAPAATGGGMPGVQAAAPLAGAVHPSVTSCLDLVRAGRHADAIPPCTEAVQNAPGNADVRAALDEARTKAATAAMEAAGEAHGAAQEAAGKAAADAASQGLPAAIPTR